MKKVSLASLPYEVQTTLNLIKTGATLPHNITKIFTHNPSPECDSEIIGTMPQGLIDQGVNVFYHDGYFIDQLIKKAEAIHELPLLF